MINLTIQEKNTIWNLISKYDNDSKYDLFTNSLSKVLQGNYSSIDIENIYLFWNKIKEFTKIDRILFTQMEIINF